MDTMNPTWPWEAKDAKWHKPGWRIEKKYTNGILIHNWFEERMQYDSLKNGDPMRSYARSYRNLPQESNNVIVRKENYLARRGQPRSFLLDEKDDTNRITWYDEKFNRRERPDDQFLPEIRYWRGKHLYWHPEKTDFPLKGESTNWGLKERVQERQAANRRVLNTCDYVTSYRDNFRPSNRPPSGGMKRLVMPNIHTTLH